MHIDMLYFEKWWSLAGVWQGNIETMHIAVWNVKLIDEYCMGVTIFEYLNQIKIELACNLLMDNELSIIEIGFDSGFNNLSHFNKQFKRIIGMPPSQYRKQFKGLR